MNNGCKNIASNTPTVTPAIDAFEVQPLTNLTTINTEMATKAKIQLRTNTHPKAEATPLPPLKLKYNGQQCPTTTNIIAIGTQ